MALSHPKKKCVIFQLNVATFGKRFPFIRFFFRANVEFMIKKLLNSHRSCENAKKQSVKVKAMDGNRVPHIQEIYLTFGAVPSHLPNQMNVFWAAFMYSTEGLLWPKNRLRLTRHLCPHGQSCPKIPDRLPVYLIKAVLKWTKAKWEIPRTNKAR